MTCRSYTDTQTHRQRWSKQKDISKKKRFFFLISLLISGPIPKYFKKTPKNAFFAGSLLPKTSLSKRRPGLRKIMSYVKKFLTSVHTVSWSEQDLLLVPISKASALNLQIMVSRYTSASILHILLIFPKEGQKHEKCFLNYNVLK